jgi:hypothetical protein
MSSNMVHITEFSTENAVQATCHIRHAGNKCFELNLLSITTLTSLRVRMMNTKFLGIQIENHLNWKYHTEQIIPTLSVACYAVRSMAHINNINTLKST